MDVFLQGLIDEHRCNKGRNHMIDHLPSLQELEPENYSDVIIKSVIMVMLFAGTDTSSVIIEWAMSALLNYPEKLERAGAEIDNLVGKNRLINESDLSKSPLLLPHEASYDCKMGEYINLFNFYVYKFI